MLRIENLNELSLARWAACGILSCIVLLISLINSRNLKAPVKLGLYSILIPLLVIVLISIVFSFLDQDDLIRQLVMPPPSLPSVSIFIFSMLLHTIFFFLNKRVGKA